MWQLLSLDFRQQCYRSMVLMHPEKNDYPASANKDFETELLIELFFASFLFDTTNRDDR